MGRKRLDAAEAAEVETNPVLIVGWTVAIVLLLTFVVLAFEGSASQDANGPRGDTAGASPVGACGGGKADDSYTVAVDSNPNPPRPEGTTFHLTVQHGGRPVTGAKVCVFADMPGMQHGAVSRTAREVGDGRYDTDLRFVMGGPWAAAITINEPGKPIVSVPVAIQVAELAGS